MAGKQFNSPADRKWQRRYQLIQERKDTYWEIDQAKRERRKANKKNFFWGGRGFKLDQIVSGRKVAVVCANKKEADEVLSVIKKERPEWGLGGVPIDDFWYFYGPEVAFGLCESSFPFADERYLRVDSRQYFAVNGYEIVDFYECCEVKDLGEMDGLDVMNTLFGMG